jgi:hypothetical protein
MVLEDCSCITPSYYGTDQTQAQRLLSGDEKTTQKKYCCRTMCFFRCVDLLYYGLIIGALVKLTLNS